MSKSSSRASWRAQLSPVGIAIGCLGCVVITASSVYTALKLGALPWPTIFTSIVALFLLRAFGHRSLNEANVTQIVMSAGSMVAGGLAFTIPGIWMLGLADEVSWVEMLVVALAGTLLGLVCTALIRRRFVEESGLEYPIGTAAAETLIATRTGGAMGRRLFGSMGLAGLWCVARDALGWMPSLFLQLPIPGVSFAIYNSPQMLSMGYLAGGIGVLFWFAGAIFGNFGLVVGGSAAGLWDVTTAQGIVSSLGMGLMMGSGLGVVLKDILPHAAALLRGRGAFAGEAEGEKDDAGGLRSRRDFGALALMVAAAALLVCIGLGLGPAVAVVVVLLAFVTTVMSAQSVGQTGIDPMEIFGLIVLLAVAAFSDATQVQLFYVAGVVAVACGLAGDVMSDFKTGKIIGSSPRAMWVGQAVGALLGTVVAVAVLVTLASAYGTDAFGAGKMFVSTQASVVATMVSGIPSIPGFVVGLLAGIALYWAGLPAMMFGLGVYLPIYMSLTASLGGLAKWAYGRVCAARGHAENAEENGTVVASGILGGESIVGVVIALVSVATGGVAG